MISKFRYLLVEFYNGDDHISGLYRTMEDVAAELHVQRKTIYNNKVLDKNYYRIVKNKQEYYIIDLKDKVN